MSGSRRSTGAVLGAVVGALLIALTACTPARHDTNDRTPAGQTTTAPHTRPTHADDRRTAVTALLRARARAVRDGDRAAYLATVDPRATQAFRAAQRRQFDNLRAVPLADWRYSLDPAVTVPTDGTGVRADELWAPAVELHYRLADIDPEPVTKPLAYLFTRRGTHWYLNSDTALENGGARTWRGPWDFGVCRVLRTADGLVLAHPGHLAAARRIAAELDAAVHTVDAIWDARWNPRVAVVVPSGQAELHEQLGDDSDLGPATDAVAAVSTAASSDISTHTASGQRVVFNPAGVDALPELSVRILLRHEVTHVAARGYTVDGTPQWLAEGFADYVGYRDSGLALANAAPALADAVRRDGPPDGLPADAEFTGHAPGVGLAYQQSWTMARYVATRFSERTLVTLYRTVAARGPTDADRLDTDVRAATGVGLDDLVAGWRRFLNTALG